MLNLRTRSFRFLVSLTTLLLHPMAKAQNTNLNLNVNLQPQPSELGLTDLLIQNDAFKVNQNNGLEIDQTKLIETIRDDIQQKLQNQNLTEYQEEAYQKLLNQLKPETFIYNKEAIRMQSMEFNKKINGVE